MSSLCASISLYILFVPSSKLFVSSYNDSRNPSTMRSNPFRIKIHMKGGRSAGDSSSGSGGGRSAAAAAAAGGGGGGCSSRIEAAGFSLGELRGCRV